MFREGHSVGDQNRAVYPVQNTRALVGCSIDSGDACGLTQRVQSLDSICSKAGFPLLVAKIIGVLAQQSKKVS